MSKEFPAHHPEVSRPSRHRRPHDGDDVAEQRRVLNERAERLGATADELQAALDSLASQAEAVLHRLKGGSLH